jgi:hypothetical protein
VPLLTNYVLLTNAPYSFVLNQFLAPATISTDPANNFPILAWRINLNARLRFVLVDTAAQRIVDYANLAGSQPAVDVTSQLPSGGSCDGGFSGNRGDFFCTNRVGGTINPAAQTIGMVNQVSMAMGLYGDWSQYSTSYNPNWQTEALAFRARINNQDTSQPDFAAPFTPVRVIHQNVSWQANDPLVHSFVSDLTDALANTKTISFDTDDFSSPFADLSASGPVNRLNPHYRPWGGNPIYSSDTSPPTKTNLTVKDPLLRRSDDWTFPTNGYPALDWLGHVHRGTPWQTLNLKSAVADPLAWQKWSGVTNASQAGLTHPTNDWRIASLLLRCLTRTIRVRFIQ